MRVFGNYPPVDRKKSMYSIFIYPLSIKVFTSKTFFCKENKIS